MRVLSNKQYKDEKVHGHYFLDFSIQNVRCYGKRQTLKLADSRGNPYHWTIILGDNGVGKTSILKGLVSLAPSPKNIYGDKQKIKLYPGLEDWKKDWDIRRFEGKAISILEANTVAAHGFKKLLKSEKLLLRVEQNHHDGYGRIIYNEDQYATIGDFLCFAYGAARKMGQSSFTSEKFSTASISLFNDEAPLINVEEFFMQADYEAKTSRSALSTAQRNKIKELLLDILPEVTDLRISKSRIGRFVEVKTPFGWVKITEMSLGYKSLIAWVVDFASRMYHYHRTKSNPFAEPAVVLIDEIDLHLHPKWQRKVLRYLSRKFPNTQFIATAHSPLIVQAAENSNLVLLKRRGSQVFIENEPDVIKNWRIDQILTSDLFGLSSARSERTEKIMAERRKILEKPNLTAKDKKQLEDIEAKIDYIPVAETPEYIEAMKLIHDTSVKLSAK